MKSSCRTGGVTIVRRAQILLAAVVLCASAGICSAQMKLGIAFEHSSYIQFEPVQVMVAIENDSGLPMVIGSKDEGGNASIDFMVQKNENEFSKRINKARMVGRLTIRPGQKRTIAVKLSRWYDVSKMGRYIVRLVVEYKGKKYESEGTVLEIVHGIEIATEEKALPNYDDTKRNYSLRYWHRKKNEHLFLVVSDPDTKDNWGLFDLGGMTRVTPPTLEVTERGIVRVVHQANKDMFIRTEFESSGEGMFFIHRTRLDRDGNPIREPGADDDEDEDEKDKNSGESSSKKTESKDEMKASKPRD